MFLFQIVCETNAVRLPGKHQEEAVYWLEHTAQLSSSTPGRAHPLSTVTERK